MKLEFPKLELSLKCQKRTVGLQEYKGHNSQPRSNIYLQFFAKRIGILGRVL
ncbi:hypothetical protein PanWU01x14_123840 [Parasponia andersonii]|uniref:Uncharacterized protein n=1 Tax=Parasponia andersonii TaxID=3476 RepID=A0A2P5CTY2_PARAD|nr:hypothetical protein PanWU01x14_123840 [Parasponia andersonii]